MQFDAFQAEIDFMKKDRDALLESANLIVQAAFPLTLEGDAPCTLLDRLKRVLDRMKE